VAILNTTILINFLTKLLNYIVNIPESKPALPYYGGIYGEKSEESPRSHVADHYVDTTGVNKDLSKSDDSFFQKSNPTVGSNQLLFLNNIRKESATDVGIPRKSKL
jgi:hypothetical protein